ncbi:MAG: RsmE family RNA methyltransferase, partial [Pseudomonadota bacterium]|nr:RsmE family RNA methyltransferase [Pseudomonadota bacterium]
RTEVKLDAERAERRLAHWHAVIASACEQCGRNRLPHLGKPIRLADWAAALDESAGVRLSLDPRGDIAVRELPPGENATLAVGPEGGLSDQDLAVLAQAGFRGLRLG